MQLQRLVGIALLALAVVSLGSGPGSLVYASNIPGTPVTISGLDDLNATVDSQARKGSGKVFALGLGVIGAGLLATGYIVPGAVGVGSALGVGFLPGIVSTGFDAAPAATADLVVGTMATAWWAPLTAGLYAPLLLLRVGQDPVVLVSIGMALFLMRHAHALRSATSHIS